MQTQYHEDNEFELPDKYMSTFIEVGVVKLILDDLKFYARANTIVNLLRVLTYLSTQQDCRAYILSQGGLEKAMFYLDFIDDKVKLEALRLSSNLI